MKTQKFLVLVLLFALMTSLILYDNQSMNNTDTKSKNLIIFVADGMGPNYVTLAREYARKFHGRENLTLDQIFMGMSTTQSTPSASLEEPGIITDSGAAATALATGSKTYNNMIGISSDQIGEPLGTILEAAKLEGKMTGIVTTNRITDATPAAFSTHVRHRRNENGIASQLAESDINVIMGGGLDYLTYFNNEQGVPILQRFTDKGYTIITDKQTLEATPPLSKLLAVFGGANLPYVIDREKDGTVPSLPEMFENAVKSLEMGPNGFVVMIEGGRIDNAGHANDIRSVISEVLEFDKTVEAALNYAKKHKDTSVMITADHESGGLSIGARDQYSAGLDMINKVTASSRKIGNELKNAIDAVDVKTIIENYTGINDLTQEEIELILEGKLWDGSYSSYEREGAFNAVMSYRTNIGWTGHGHTGSDVGIYAFGPVVGELSPFLDNTEFAFIAADTISASLQKTTALLQEQYVYPPYLRDGLDVMLPVNLLSERLGYKTRETEEYLIIEGNGHSYQVHISSTTVTVDGQTVQARYEENILYMPLSFIQSLISQQLYWDEMSERLVLGTKQSDQTTIEPS